MENLFTILIVLALALFVMVVVLERFGKPMDEQQQASIARWILPLVALLAVAQLIRYWLGD